MFEVAKCCGYCAPCYHDVSQPIFSSFDDIWQYENYNCTFQIANNPKLDTTPICQSPNFIDRIGADVRFGVTDNKVDCGCQGTVTPGNREELKTCEKVTGKLVISGFREEGDGLPSLSLITVINGDLEVFNTSLKSLSFLDNVQVIRTKTGRSISRINIDIHDNPEMTRFGMRNLKDYANMEFKGHLNVNFQRLHPDFCLEIEEMIGFLNMNTKFINLEAAGYCNLNSSTVSLQNAKVCVFVSMSELDTGCVHLIGNLLIDSGDEEHVGKLNNVIYILGTLTVQNTNLFNLNFLNNLKSIANLDEKIPSMRIFQNQNLRTMNFVSLSLFATRYAANNRVILSNNHPELFSKVLDCLNFQYKAQTNVSINGRSCRAIPHSLSRTYYDEEIQANKKVDYEFDDFIDYSEEGNAPWEVFYDGVLHLEADTTGFFYRFFYQWISVNDVAALIGFSINIFHLTMLFHPDLRSNFIYILMIAISLCDLIFAATFVVEWLLSSGWIYYIDPYCHERSDYHILISRLEAPIQEITRKSSGVLALLMALYRTLSVILPTSNLVLTVGKPRWAVLMILGVMMLQGSWEAVAFWSCTMKMENRCGVSFNEITGFYVQCIADEKEKGDTDILRNMMFFDGNFTVFLAILYLLVTIVLLNQLRTARNRRKALKSSENQKENTSLLVTVMATTFFVSEVTYGFFFITQQYFEKNLPYLADIMDQGQVVLWTMVTVNSTIHCLICFLLSSQYRGVVKGMFWIGGMARSQSVISDLATIASIQKEQKLSSN